MNLSEAFKSQPRLWIFAEMVVASLVIGAVDFATGYQISLFLFYGLPIFAIAWLCDGKSAFLMAILCGLIWWWADAASGHLYVHNWLEAWETLMRLGFFIFVAWAASAARAKSDVAKARIALLEHSQRLEQQIVSVSENERRRIGQDLHDGLCQYLAALACAATSLRDDLTESFRQIEAGSADEIAQGLRDAVIETRNLARGLVPVPLEDGGLVSALRGLAHSVSRLQGINCTFQSDEISHRQDETVEMHFYRIAQEAINNATRHGAARNIAISLTATESRLALKVIDDGIGISKLATNHGGMGLNVMNYRARLSGGELTIQDAPDGGTIVYCSVPTKKSEIENNVVCA
jgi:signal transduction histidine kinase